MPQTSDPVKNTINKWFPWHPDMKYGQDEMCRQLLLAKGWTEKAGMFSPPTSAYYGPREDYVMLKYLREEWDYDFEMAPLV